jgi:CheY-like chemotaxis protein
MDTIGVVDDDEDCATLYCYLLEHKWKVTVFQDWQKALNEFEVSPPKLILLDISLPDISGEKILELIRGNASLKHIPVIAVTGHSLPRDREKFLKLGFDEYVSKPIVDHLALSRLIEGVLANKRG